MDSARHVITRISNPRFLSRMTYYDVASTIHQSLPLVPRARSTPPRRAPDTQAQHPHAATQQNGSRPMDRSSLGAFLPPPPPPSPLPPPPPPPTPPPPPPPPLYRSVASHVSRETLCATASISANVTMQQRSAPGREVHVDLLFTTLGFSA